MTGSPGPSRSRRGGRGGRRWRCSSSRRRRSFAPWAEFTSGERTVAQARDLSCGLAHVFDVVWKPQPRMSPLLPNRPRRRSEGRIRKRAHRDGHNSRRGLRGVEHGRAAVRTEVEGAFLSVVRDADVLPSGALGRYLFCVESRLDSEDASGSTLAGETVADRDSNRLSLDGQSELLTTTRGASSAHDRDRRQGSARASFRNTGPRGRVLTWRGG